MLINENALNTMSYFMDSEHEILGMVSEYHVYMNDRLAVRVFVQIEDDKRIAADGHDNCFPVWVGRHDGTNLMQIPDAHAVQKMDETTGKLRISSDSVKYVTLPQLPWLLVELYVPKN